MAEGTDAQPHASMMRASAVMSAGTALSRLTGFARIAVMAWAIGGVESKLPDSYNLANSMPNMVYQLVVGEVLATLFVPVFVQYLTTRARDEAWRLASTILNLAVIVAGVFVAITIAFAPWIVRAFTIGYRGETPELHRATSTFLLRLFLPQMIFYAAGAVLTGLLNAHRRFAAPMFAPVLNNFIVIATFIVFRIQHDARVPELGTLTGSDKLLLGGGTTLGVIAMTLALWPFVRRLPGGYSVRALEWRHPAIRHVGRLAKYSFAYVIVNQVGLWIVYLLANQRQTGALSAYQTSWILYQLPYGIFAVSIMTYIVREVSEHHVRGDMDSVRRDVSLGLRTTAAIILPAAAGFVALSEPLTRVLLQHGVFTAVSTDLYARTFLLMAIGLGAYAAFQQMMRAFYAMQDTRTPLLVNIGAVGANVLAAFPLYAAMGVPGLALAHAISYFTGALIAGVILRQRLRGLDGRRLVSAHARIALASALTGASAFLIARAIGPAVNLDAFGGQLAQVGASVAAGLAVYLAAARALKIDELRPLTQMILGRWGGKAS